jgi:hypothetical protein
MATDPTETVDQKPANSVAAPPEGGPHSNLSSIVPTDDELSAAAKQDLSSIASSPGEGIGATPAKTVENRLADLDKDPNADPLNPKDAKNMLERYPLELEEARLRYRNAAERNFQDANQRQLEANLLAAMERLLRTLNAEIDAVESETAKDPENREALTRRLQQLQSQREALASNFNQRVGQLASYVENQRAQANLPDLPDRGDPRMTTGEAWVESLIADGRSRYLANRVEHLQDRLQNRSTSPEIASRTVEFARQRAKESDQAQKQFLAKLGVAGDGDNDTLYRLDNGQRIARSNVPAEQAARHALGLLSAQSVNAHNQAEQVFSKLTGSPQNQVAARGVQTGYPRGRVADSGPGAMGGTGTVRQPPPGLGGRQNPTAARQQTPEGDMTAGPTQPGESDGPAAAMNTRAMGPQRHVRQPAGPGQIPDNGASPVIRPGQRGVRSSASIRSRTVAGSPDSPPGSRQRESFSFPGNFPLPNFDPEVSGAENPDDGLDSANNSSDRDNGPSITTWLGYGALGTVVVRALYRGGRKHLFRSSLAAQGEVLNRALMSDVERLVNEYRSATNASAKNLAKELLRERLIDGLAERLLAQKASERVLRFRHPGQAWKVDRAVQGATEGLKLKIDQLGEDKIFTWLRKKITGGSAKDAVFSKSELAEISDRAKKRAMTGRMGAVRRAAGRLPGLGPDRPKEALEQLLGGTELEPLLEPSEPSLWSQVKAVRTVHRFSKLRISILR